MINLKRENIGLCRNCEADPKDEKFFGNYNEHGTHAKSDNGWWLRIVHTWDYDISQRHRLDDRVGDLLCPDCLEIHEKHLDELLSPIIGD